MKEKTTKLWIPLYVDKWIFGSTRIELEPAERGVFVDLMALAAKDSGYIRANESTPYPPRQLSGLLNIPEELLLSTLKKCLEFSKIEEPRAGIYKLTNWDKYQFSDRWKREIEGSTSAKPEGTSAKPEAIRYNKTGEERKGQSRGQTLNPTLAEVQEYCKTKGIPADPVKFWAHYQGVGWKIGAAPIKDWQAVLLKWTTPQVQAPQQTPAAPRAPKMAYDKPAETPIEDPRGWEPLK